MNYYDTNKEILINYFRSGEKSRPGRFTGVEIEHFITEGNAGASYERLCAAVRELSEDGDIAIEEEGKYFGFFNDRYSVTFEPSAQLEISVAPRESSEETFAIYNSFMKRFKEKTGMTVHTTGYHPYDRAESLALIPKARYRFMDRYFRKTGAHGINMMRATASLQVSVDYFGEEDFVRKFRLANILSPIFALITDNSPVYEGEKNSVRSVRTAIWGDVDPARCGTIPTLMDDGFGYESYADFAMNTPLIFHRGRDGNAVYTGELTPARIYKNEIIGAEETEHILSMLFFDARLKTYIEIRPADCVPEDYAAAYNELIRGIFCDGDRLASLCGELAGISVKDIENAKAEIIKKGYEAEIYGRNAHDLALRLFRGAGEETEPLLTLVREKRTLREGGLYK